VVRYLCGVKQAQGLCGVKQAKNVLQFTDVQSLGMSLSLKVKMLTH